MKIGRLNEYEIVVTNDDYIVKHHRVFDIPMMPGVTFLDIILRILISEGYNYRDIEIRQVIFKQPIVTSNEFDKKVKIIIQENDRHFDLQVVSRKVKKDKIIDPAWEENFSAQLHLEALPLDKTIDIVGLKKKANFTEDFDTAYQRIREMNIRHLEFMQAGGQVHIADDYLLARIHLSDLAMRYLEYFFIHPVFLDASTVVPNLFQEVELINEEKHLFIPVFIESFRIWDRLSGGSCYVYVPGRKNMSMRNVLSADIEIYNEQGRIVAALKNFSATRVRSKDLITNFSRVKKPEETAVEAKTGRAAEPGTPEPGQRTDRSMGESAREFIERDLRSLIAAPLKLEPSRVKLEAGFYDLGLDSVQLLDLVKELEKKLGESLYPTLLFEYNTAGKLASYLMENYGTRYPGIPSIGGSESGPPPPVLETGDTDNLRTILEQDIRDMVAGILQTAGDKIKVEAGFYDLGLDSVQLLDLVKELEKKLGESLYPTLLFEYNTISKLVDYLAGEFGQKAAVPAGENRPVIEVKDTSDFFYIPRWLPLSSLRGSFRQSRIVETEGEKSVLIIMTPEGDPLARALEKMHQHHGDRVVLARLAGRNRRISDRSFHVNAAKPGSFDSCLKHIKRIDTVYFLGGLQDPGGEDDRLKKMERGMQTGLLSLFHLFQAFNTYGQGEKSIEIVIFGSHHYQVVANDRINPFTAGLHGLSMSLSKEYPSFTFSFIDLGLDLWFQSPPEQLEDTLGAIADARRYNTPGGVVALRRGETYTRILEPTELMPEVELPLRERGVYVILGGTGGIGFETASFLAERFRAKLVLLGRSAKDRKLDERLALLRQKGGEPLYIRADAANSRSLQKAFVEVKSRFGRINGVFHSAVVLNDKALRNMDERDFNSVLEPKVRGSVVLSEVLKKEPLDFLIFYSSAQSFIGNPGQSNYASACNFKDVYALYLDQHSPYPVKIINWGYWGSVGVAASEELKRRYEGMGIYSITPAEGIEAMLTVLANPRNQVVVMKARRAVMESFGTLYPFLFRKTESREPEKKPVEDPVRPAMPQALNDRDIAVIGISGRFPGANDLATFWDKLAAGIDCITEVPPDRWEMDKFYDPDNLNPAKTYCKWGGFIDGVDLFDPLFFNISPRDAEFMDPQERLLLEESWHALEDAGYTPASIKSAAGGNRDVGVFIGVMWSDYEMVGAEMHRFTLRPATSISLLANRISYVLDFHGPSLAVDTACSSSLMALHLARGSIRKGECDTALVGGVNLSLHYSKYLYLSQMQMLSAGGRCKPFGEDADGYVPGEGVGVILLKRLDLAVEDNDFIYGIVKGTAVNHGGKTGGFSVPNPAAQADLIQTAFRKSGVDPDQIRYIEAHGTGTSLGDPIEIAGLTRAFGPADGRRQYCAVGSVKSNIGHTEGAAGIASVLKVILQLKNRQIAPSLHAGRSNPKIDFENSRFYVPQKLEDWECVDGTPRLAGISGFGAGGTNVHVVMEEYVDGRTPPATPSGDGPFLIVLSAGTEERLNAYAAAFREFLSRQLQEKDKNRNLVLRDVAFTLQVGRVHMAERLAVLVTGPEELLEKLSSFCGGQVDIPGLYRNHLGAETDKFRTLVSGSEGELFSRELLKGRKLDKIAQSWVLGMEIDWRQLYWGEEAPRRLPLPVYPFVRESYWIEKVDETEVSSILPGNDLHPLIHRNVSTFREQVFETRLTGNEYFFTDHAFGDSRVLPGVAFLEMILAAAQFSLEGGVRLVENLTWEQPLVAGEGPLDLRISLHPRRDGLEAEISTRPETGEATVLCRGEIPLDRGIAPETGSDSLEIEAVVSRCSRQWTGEECYRIFEEKGTFYGDSFRPIRMLYGGEGEALAYLELPAHSAVRDGRFVLNPSFLDGALQAVKGIIGQPGEDPEIFSLPFMLGECDITGPLPHKGYAYVAVSSSDNPEDAGISVYQCCVCDEQGRILIRIRDFAVKTLPASQLHPPAAVGEQILYYRSAWEKSSVYVPEDRSSLSGPVLVFSANPDMINSLVEAGQGAIRVKPGPKFRRHDGDDFDLNPGEYDDYVALIRDLVRSDRVPRRILFLWQTESGKSETFDIPFLMEMGVYALFHLVRAWLAEKVGAPTCILYVYPGLDDLSVPLNAAVGGFARSVAIENPGIVIKTIEVRDGGKSLFKNGIGGLGEDLLKEFTASDGPAEIYYQEGQRYTRRLIPHDPIGREDRSLPIREKGVYLITGGLGGLGLVFAHYLIRKARATLLLTGRSPLSSAKREKIKYLKSLGGRVHYYKADVSVEKEVKRLISRIKSRFDKIDGVIHSAGILRDNLVLKKSREDFAAVSASKVLGTIYMDELLKEEDLDFLILFSSISSVLGGTGQCDYSFANRFLDHYAEFRTRLQASKQRSGKTISIGWPYWEEGGMTVAEEFLSLFKENLGIVPLPSADGIKAFEESLSADVSHLIVLKGNPPVINRSLGIVTGKKSSEMTARPAITISGVRQKRRESGSDGFRLSSPAEGAVYFKPEEREVQTPTSLPDKGIDKAGVSDYLKKLVSEKLKLPPDRISAEEPLEKFGIDSVVIMKVTRELEKKLGTLSKTLFFEYQSISELAEYFVDNHDEALRRVTGDTNYSPARIVPKDPVPAPAAEIAEPPDDELKRKTETYLKTVLSRRLKLPVEKIAAGEPLENYGIDSVVIVRVTRDLEKDFGGLSKTLFFEYRNLEELTGYFLAHHRDPLIKKFNITPSGVTTVERRSRIVPPQEIRNVMFSKFETARTAGLPRGKTQAKNREIAIIGISGRYPQAQNLDEFWENLKSGTDCITEIPPDRWDYHPYYTPDKGIIGKTYSKWGGFIKEIDRFDPLFFNISPRDADYTDPQERLFLEVVWEVLEDAGYTRSGLKEKKVGVFTGVMNGEYQLLETDKFGDPVSPTSIFASIPNRVSYFFDFRGPSLAVDTMCSSSLYALKIACESMGRGESDLAIVGGVNALLHPSKYVQLSLRKFASSDGKCRGFGAGGDGYVPGEGIGAIFLKKIDEAVADGDHVYAVIKGVAVNHDGKTNGYTVPNPRAQTEVIRTALEEADINPRSINYIEAHGTGTSLGDPIEITGLTHAFKKFTQDRQYCAIGSIKSNIGHLESAAGIASLTKVILQMKYRQLVPSIHSEPLNPNIDFPNTPFFVQRELADWQAPVVRENGREKQYPRIAGISSFGAGGANAHVILQEFRQDRAGLHSFPVPVLVVLSAKSDDRLKCYARRLVDFLKQPEKGIEKDTVTLHRIAYTLQTGREPMESRLALVVSAVDELAEKLEAFCGGRPNVANLFVGKVETVEDDPGNSGRFVPDGADVGRLIREKNYEELARWWVDGADIDWGLFYPRGVPGRISLPAYPFEARRCWVPAGSGVSRGSTPRLHPLLDAVVPLLPGQGTVFRKRINRTDLIVNHHQVRGRYMIPGVAYLEMARAAASQIEGMDRFYLSGIVWLRPFDVEMSSKDIYVKISGESGQLNFSVSSHDKEGTDIIHAQGKIITGSPAETAVRLSIADIKSGCPKKVENEMLYNRFRDRGMVYGQYFRGIREAWVNKNEAIASISLADDLTDDLDQYVLHPALLDAAMQTMGTLVGPGIEKDSPPLLPFSVEKVEILQPLRKKGFAYTRLAGSNRFNLAILDESGTVCVKLHDVALREVGDPLEQMFYAPRWKPSPLQQPGEDRSPLQPAGGREGRTVLIVHGPNDPGMTDALKQEHAGDSILEIKLGKKRRLSSKNRWEIGIDDTSGFLECLDKAGPVQVVYFLTEFRAVEPGPVETTFGERYRETAVINLFRLVKALSDRQLSAGPLKLTVVTYQVFCVLPEDRIEPTSAGITGFARSLAMEFPRLEVACIDVGFGPGDRYISPDTIRETAGHIAAEPGNPAGDCIALRNGVRYTREIEPIRLPAGQAPYRPKGVYMIAGGFGGIGLELSRFLAQSVNARIVLLGRSDLDEEKKGLIRQLEAAGGQVLYMQADITDEKAMQRAIKKVKATFGSINGVFHSALVSRDSTIENLDEESLNLVLAPKVTGSVVLSRVLRDESLDFMMFFSSGHGLTGSPGQSAYVAASAFEDAFALFLNQQREYPVRVIDWGYWGSVGVVASQHYRKQYEKIGAYSIEPPEGMEAVKRVLVQQVDQLMVLKANRRLLERIGVKRPVEDTGDVESFLQNGVETGEIFPRLDPSGVQEETLSGFDDTLEEIEMGAVENLEEAAGEYLKSLFSRVLQMDKDKIDSRATFEVYGVDSVLVVDLTRELEKDFGDLPRTLLFENMTIEKLGRYLVSNHGQKLAEYAAPRSGYQKPAVIFNEPGIDRPPGDETIIDSYLGDPGTDLRMQAGDKEGEEGDPGDIRDLVYSLSDNEVDGLLKRFLNQENLTD